MGNSSPQVEDGYTRIANELLEALARTNIPGQAGMVLRVVMRRTYGWGKSEDAISISQFERATGMDRKSVRRAINRLTDMNILNRGKDAPRDVVRYSINKHYATWRGGVKNTPIGARKPPKVGADTPPTKEILKKEYIVVFERWMAHENLIRHRKFTDGMVSRINGRIEREGYEIEDLLKAIDNYAGILKSSQHYFNHRWTLELFFTRKNGFPMFTDEADPWTNFRNERSKPKRRGGGRKKLDPSERKRAMCRICDEIFFQDEYRNCPNCGSSEVSR